MQMLIDWHYWLNLLLVPFCIQVAAIVIGKLISTFIKRKLHRHLEKHTFPYILADAMRGIPIAWCSGVGLYWTIGTMKFINSTVAYLLSAMLYAIIIFTSARVLARAVSGMVSLHIKRAEDNTQATSLLSNIISFVIYCTGILIILQYLGISVTPLLTALGVGGMAVALGLQDTLANIFAGIHIILSGQLQIHDFIKLSNGDIGQVVDITWRFTKILSPSDNIIIIPNKNVSSSTITNYNMPREEIGISLAVGVSYDSDLEYVEKISIEVARDVLQKVEGRVDFEPSVRFCELADSSINFTVNVKSTDFLHQSVIKHELIKALIKRYRAENIDIPFPVRTVIKAKSS